jgi:hypothetical protein
VLPDSLGRIGSYFMTECTKYNCDLTLNVNNSLESIGDGFLSYCESYNSNINVCHIEDVDSKPEDWSERKAFEDCIGPTN